MSPRAHNNYNCRRCGDPLPCDGICDCAGDPDRDTETGYRDLGAHATVVRLRSDFSGGNLDLGPETGNAGDVLEVWT